MAANEEENIVVAGGIRYTKKDAEARGLKQDSPAHAKKIAFGEIPVGTIAGTEKESTVAESVPAPITAAAANPPAEPKK